MPGSLDDLHGPYDGLIDLPHAVRWQPDRFGVDISDPDWRAMAYQALLAEGLVELRRRMPRVVYAV